MSEPENEQTVVVKNGFLTRTVQYKTIKVITGFLAIMLICDVLFSCHLFVSAIRIRSHLGYFINMISSGDGDTLPTLQAIPVLFFLVINVIMILFLYMAFDDYERPDLNRLMFYLVLFGFILIVAILIIVICVIVHAYSTHEKLHDGIVTAMRHYLNSTVYKSQMDQLQIEFQCCGSKKYDEWYNVSWLDHSLEEGKGSSADGNTPFSCCSMKSLFPCIHHNIEVTGKAYLYTPEFNLSISTRGCYEMIRERKQQIGWRIVGNLFAFVLLEGLTVSLFRFIQTAHYEKKKFSGKLQSYTVWLFGSYAGKVKPDERRTPEVPPVPNDLRD